MAEQLIELNFNSLAFMAVPMPTVSEVEYRVAELARVTGINLRLAKSVHFDHYHVHQRDSNGTWLAWITRPLIEVLYIVNAILVLEEAKVHG